MQFSKKYVDANRNQSIMRYQDILDSTQKAVNDIQRVSENIQQNEDDFAPHLLELDAPIIEQRRGSKYMKKNDFNFDKKRNNNNQNVLNPVNRERGLSGAAGGDNNYSSAIYRKGSIASSVSSSYSAKKEFGTRKHKKNKSKGNRLKRMFQWTK